MTEGLAVAESIYTGRGRKDVAKSWIANINIYDSATGAPILKVKGLNYVKLDTDEKPDPHVFQRVTWKPDITLLTQDQLCVLSANSAGQLDTVLDLIAHKNPTLRVLELNVDESDVSTLWFTNEDQAVRVAYAQYDFATADAKTLVTVMSANESKRDTAFHLMNASKDGLDLSSTETTYDLAIVKASKCKDAVLAQVLHNMQTLLAPYAIVTLIRQDSELQTKLAGVVSRMIPEPDK
jgi:hypothetical protein